MENSIYLGLSRQMVLQTNMNIAANNIANMNTTGFRGQSMLFEEYISDPRGADDPLSFVYDRGQYQISDQGPLRQTGNPLDVALEGPGFFGVRTPEGETVYTRAGSFLIGPEGVLTTPEGHAVAGQGGGPISIPAGSTEISIAADGAVSNQDGEIGRLMVVEFDNIQQLEAMGDNLYTSAAEGIPAESTVVAQGMLEGSNVKPIAEMTNMIETLRAFQSVHRLLDSENERLRTAIQRLTRQS